MVPLREKCSTGVLTSNPRVTPGSEFSYFGQVCARGKLLLALVDMIIIAHRGSK